MYSFIGIAILFFAAVMAITTETWDRYNIGMSKITLSGLFALLLTLVGIVVSSMSTYQNVEDVAVMKEEVKSLTVRNRTMEKKLKDASFQNAVYEGIMGAIEMGLEVGKDETTVAEKSADFDEGKKPEIDTTEEEVALVKGQAVVLSWSLNVREGPGMDFPVISSLEEGDVVTIEAVDGSWFDVNHRGVNTGWVNSNFLRRMGEDVNVAETETTTALPEPTMRTVDISDEGNVAMVTVDLLYVRSGPGKEYPIVTSLVLGDLARVKRDQRGWLNVELEEHNGWISSSYVKLIKGRRHESSTALSTVADSLTAP